MKTLNDLRGRVIVVAYGLGVDSTAVLVGFARQRITPFATLFADVGCEKPQTYAYLPIMSAYLARYGLPPVTVVRYTPIRATYHTLEEECLQQHKLPSLAYGPKTCSIKWKHQPQHKWLKQQPEIKQLWSAGGKVLRVIGYDAGPADCRRVKDFKSDLYENWYPLQDWGWDRDRCKWEIAREGLPVPPKSSCFFCPAIKPDEVNDMAIENPDLLRRLVHLEDNAQPNLTSLEGLWRKTCKRDDRPVSIAEYVRRKGLLEDPAQLRVAG